MFAQAGTQVVQETQQSLERVYHAVIPNLPMLLGALVILVVGWLGAVLVASIVRGALRSTGFHRKLAEWFTGDAAGADKFERAIAKGTYYLTLVFVLVAFFDALGVTQVTASLGALLNEILAYLPRILGAGLLLLVAWVVATFARFLSRWVAAVTKLDEKLHSQAETEGERRQSAVPSSTIANTVYWLVFLLFLPTILSALALPALFGPVQEMLNPILAFLPNLFAACLILSIGWLVARAVQRITTNLLAAVGTDGLTERAGLASFLGEKRLSHLLGLVVYILVLLPVLVVSLSALRLEAVTGPASQMLNAVLAAVPIIFAAVLVVGVAYFVGRVVAGLTTSLLTGVGFNRLPAKLGLAKADHPGEGWRTPSEIAGYLVLVGTMLFALMQALPLLGFDPMAQLIFQFLVFGGEVLMGLVIFGFGLYFAHLAAQIVRASSLSQANLFGWAARISITVVAGVMALRQMGLANEVITWGFAIVFGAFAVAFALAFGLGGREAAGRTLHELLESRKAEGFRQPRQTGARTAQAAPTTPAPSTPGAPLDLSSQPDVGTFTGVGSP